MRVQVCVEPRTRIPCEPRCAELQGLGGVFCHFFLHRFLKNPRKDRVNMLGMIAKIKLFLDFVAA